MNNQEIQIIVGILLLLVYVYCIRNNEGYRRRGRTSCQTRPVSGRKIYGRVKPLRKCRRGLRRGYISELKRVITPVPRGRVPVNLGHRLGMYVTQKSRLKKMIYQNAKMGANYMVIIPSRDGKTMGARFYKGASRATKLGGPRGVRSYRILPPGRARAGRRVRRGRRGGMARFIQRCKNMFRRRNIPVGDSPRMRSRRASLSPQQWARDDKL